MNKNVPYKTQNHISRTDNLKTMIRTTESALNKVWENTQNTLIIVGTGGFFTGASTVFAIVEPSQTAYKLALDCAFTSTFLCGVVLSHAILYGKEINL